MIFWHWFIVSGLLFIIEITTLTTFFLFFGVATLIMGFVTFLTPNMHVIPQAILFGVLSLISMFSSYYFFKRISRKNSQNQDFNKSRMRQYIGKSFILDTNSYAGVAKVKIGDVQWRVIIDNAHAEDKILITDVKSTSFIAEHI